LLAGEGDDIIQWLNEAFKLEMLTNTTTSSFTASSSHQIRFVEEPKKEWIVRSKPALFSCSAVNAKKIRVKCNSKWLDDDRIYLERVPDHTRGEPSIRANVEIQRSELDAWFADMGEFACQCWAFGEQKLEEDNNEDLVSEDDEDNEYIENGGKTSTRIGRPAIVRSDIATIRLAFLRKHFNQVPISQRIHEGKTVQLHCHPPEGDPKPEVFYQLDNFL
jgi:netrin receptor unc-5